MSTSQLMRKILGIMILCLVLNGCGKPIKGTYNKEDSKFWTSLFETATGGSISSHFVWGEKKDKLLKRADDRCKRVNPEFEVVNFITIYQGNLIGSELTQYEYDCVKKKIENQIETKSSTSVSNNSINRSFVCSYGGEKSKIKISGSTATETTAIGISINYSIVNLSDKGAFTLRGSSKQDRAWFIGAQSFLLLGTDMIPYDCN